jgi:hypothetical protein
MIRIHQALLSSTWAQFGVILRRDCLVFLSTRAQFAATIKRDCLVLLSLTRATTGRNYLVLLSSIGAHFEASIRRGCLVLLSSTRAKFGATISRDCLAPVILECAYEDANRIVPCEEIRY